jgi:deoxyribonuclease-4
MHLGIHVSISGKLYLAIDQASRLGCSAIQIFSRNPRQLRKRELPQKEIDEFRRLRRRAKLEPVVIHMPYVANLASWKKDLYKGSIRAYIEDIKEAQELGADYFVTHMGSHRGRSLGWGLRRFARGLKSVLESTHPRIMILLENTAGSGSQLGSSFWHHSYVIEAINDRDRIGVCLDTAHAYQAGFDITDRKVLDTLLKEMDRLFGLQRLKVIHLNDSATSLGSHLDRHEHIGKGKIGLEAFRQIVNHPYLKNLTFILETPKFASVFDKINLKVVRSLRELSV